MPVKSLSGDQPPAAVPQAPPAAAKVLYAVDAVLTPASPVTDIASLTAIAEGAVRAGHGHVLDTSHVIFPNGAVTLVLILAESHLSIHTWPEENLIAIDLQVSFGEGEEMRTEVSAKFRRERVAAELAAAGFALAGWWTDEKGRFGLSLSVPA